MDFTFGWCFTAPVVLLELSVVLVFIAPHAHILHFPATATAFPVSHSPTHSTFILARTSQSICVTRSTPSHSRQRGAPLLFVRIRTSSLPQQRFQMSSAISEDMRHDDEPAMKPPGSFNLPANGKQPQDPKNQKTSAP